MLEGLEGLHSLKLNLLVIMWPEEGSFEHQSLSTGLILDLCFLGRADTLLVV